MAGHSSNGAARSDSVQTTTGPNIDSANPSSGQENPLPQDNTGSTYQPNEYEIPLPSGDTIYVYENKIRDLLLEKPDDRSAATVSVILEYMGRNHQLKDLIYNSHETDEGEREYTGVKTQFSRFRERILHSAHIEGLWETASLNTYDVRTPMPLLSGQWSGKSWQISKGLLVNTVKWLRGVQDLPGFPLEGTFKMTLSRGNERKYTATFGDQLTWDPIYPTHIDPNMQPCHLAIPEKMRRSHLGFRSPDANCKVEVYICLASPNVLVGQALNADTSKISKMVLVKD